MNICYLCSEYPLADVPYHGGIGSFIQTLGRALVNHRYKVFVLGFYPSEGISADQGVQIVKLRATRWPALNLLPLRRALSRSVNALNQEHGLDLIEASEGSSALLPWSADLATVVRLHGGHHFLCHFAGVKTRFHRAIIERYCLRRADFLVAVSEFVGTQTVALVGLNRPAARVLPSPINIELFKPETVEPRGKEEAPVVVFAGTLYCTKGIIELIEAMSVLLKDCPSAKLLVAGRDGRIRRTPISTRSYLEGRMDERTKKAVNFLGHVPHSQMPELYNRASVCVFPSHMESQGLVAVEAMACGRPVVYTRTGPGPEIIEDGVRKILGVGRLIADPDHESVEYAVLITDAWQKRELGSILTDFCMEIAKKWKLKRIVAQTTTDNRPMISVFRKRGFAITVNGSDSTVEVVKEIE